MKPIQLLPSFTQATVFRGLEPDVSTVRGYEARINAQNGASTVARAQLDELVDDYRW